MVCGPLTRRMLSVLALWAITTLVWAADGPPTITAEALERRLMAGDPPMVLDIRGSAMHLAGTIPGAIDAGTDPRGFLPDGRPGEVVLLMEPAADVAAAGRWYHRLTGYQLSVTILTGGMDAWVARGLPVEAPSEAFSRPGQVPFTIPRGLCEMNTPAKAFE